MSSKLLVLFVVFFFTNCLLYSQDIKPKRGVKLITENEIDENKDQRIALVIGISSYKESPLRNPINDSADMAEVLKKCGFEVTLKNDINQYDMENL